MGRNTKHVVKSADTIVPNTTVPASGATEGSAVKKGFGVKKDTPAVATTATGSEDGWS